MFKINKFKECNVQKIFIINFDTAYMYIYK